MKFVRYSELKRDWSVPFTRVHINRLEAQGKFPRRVHLSSNTIAWRSDELQAWIEARSAERAPAA